MQPGLIVPGEKVFELPEKVLQFGTGVLLRGLPDYFIDKANRQGLFNGRIVIVKSTSQGDTDGFSKQDGLYTTCIRGVENGEQIDESIINASISRVITATDNWHTVLECAHNPDLQIIISNTTEVGITLVEDDIRLQPPISFPGKLLAFLYERFKVFAGTGESGMIIIPTELITENGEKLRNIVLQLATMNKLESDFIQWLMISNHFCNSLVDRIVPGKLQDHERINIEKRLGYRDELMIMSESFRLWAIESGEERVKQALSFAGADEGVVIAPDIEKFRELKLRLLNGTHTFSCALAWLAGFTTVREAMDNEQMCATIYGLATREIAPAISGKIISYDEAIAFAKKVMDRFRNPYLDHSWLNISVQYTSKMKMRNVPVLLAHYSKSSQPPELMSMGFAAYLLFMKGNKNSKGQYEGFANGVTYPIQDESAGILAAKWHDTDPGRLVENVLADKDLWGEDLRRLNGFSETVKSHLHELIKYGAMAAIRRVCLNKTEAG